MKAVAALLRGLLRFTVVATLVVMAIVGIFVAWWLVLIAALALSVYFGVRRFFGIRRAAKPVPPRADGAVIEGEFEVERDDAGGAGRVIEVLPDPPERHPEDKPRP